MGDKCYHIAHGATLVIDNIGFVEHIMLVTADNNP